MKKYTELLQKHQNKGFTLLDQTIVSGGNFITSFMYARILGLEIYGFFVLCWMLVLFISGLQQSFIFNPMTSIYAYKSIEENRDQYIQSLFSLQLLFSIMSSVFVMLMLYIDILFIQTPRLEGLLFIIPAAVFAFTMQDFFRKKFILTGKPQITFLLDVLCTALLLGLLFSGYASTVRNIFSIITISFITTAITGYLISGIQINLHLFNFTISNHWMQGKWLILTSVIQLFSGNYFIVAAGVLLGTAEIGIIRIAQNIVGVLNILFIAMESYIPVSASKIFHNLGAAALIKYLKSVTIKGLLITSILCISIALSSSKIIAVLYGRAFIEYSGTVQIYALFYILVFISIPLRFAIRTIEQNHHILIGYIISSVFSFISANVLITHYGIYGVLSGIIISQLLTQFWYIYSLKNYCYAHHSLSTR
ncbi:hypothetical protein [Flavobacterium sp.]|uniref:lipopolysaccharide biosynthesis protein n=1 Tax=Flavobacterium sp. TaxID=239 RepID=UPI0025B8CA54|nr:hypothetical protein [Flavobacterium sp.]